MQHPADDTTVTFAIGGDPVTITRHQALQLVASIFSQMTAPTESERRGMAGIIELWDAQAASGELEDALQPMEEFMARHGKRLGL